MVRKETVLEPRIIQISSISRPRSPARPWGKESRPCSLVRAGFPDFFFRMCSLIFLSLSFASFFLKHSTVYWSLTWNPISITASFFFFSRSKVAMLKKSPPEVWVLPPVSLEKLYFVAEMKTNAVVKILSSLQRLAKDCQGSSELKPSFEKGKNTQVFKHAWFLILS